MGKIDKFELTKLLILWILFCTTLFIGELFKIVWILLISFFTLGFFINSFIRARKYDFKNPIEIKSIVIALIISLFFFLFTISWWNRKLTHAIFEINNEQFEKLFDPSKLKPHRYIFSFDNSGGKDHRIGDSINTKAIPIHKQYIDEVKNHYGLDCFKHNNYRDLIKSRLCYDLSLFFDKNDCEILVLKIGDPFVYYFTDDHDDFVPCTNENIEGFIENICSSNYFDYVEQITDFETFYSKIYDITGNEKYTYTINLYSDFIDDMNRPAIINERYLRILNLQKKLIERNIIQNLFVAAPYGNSRNNLENDERNILPALKLPFINYYKLDSIDKETIILNEIRETKELLILYFEKKTSDAVKLVFKQDKGTIFIRFIENSDGYAIYDGKNRYIYSKKNPIQNDTVTISYEKTSPPINEFSKLEITQNGTHYYIQCKLEKNELSNFKGFFILICFGLLGGFLPFIVKSFIKTPHS